MFDLLLASNAQIYQNFDQLALGLKVKRFIDILKHFLKVFLVFWQLFNHFVISCVIFLFEHFFVRIVGKNVLTEQFLPPDTIVFLSLKHALNQVFSCSCYSRAYWKINGLVPNLFFQFNQRFCFPWDSSVKHFIKNHSQRPNVCLLSVLLSTKNLWWHVQRSSHDWLQQLLMLINSFWKTQICNLNVVIMKQQVCRLQVSVNNFFFMQVLKSFEDLLHLTKSYFKKCHSLTLSKIPFPFEKRVKTLPITVFANDVKVSRRPTIKKYVRLCIKELNEILVLSDLHVDNLLFKFRH